VTRALFDATEPAALARQLFGPPGQDFVWYKRRRRNSAARFDASLRANAEAIWDLGDYAYRDTLLMYGAIYRAIELWPVMWKGLDTGDDRLASSGLMALHRLLPQRQPAQHQLTKLIGYARAPGRHFPRMAAVYLLRNINYPKLEGLLLELRHDEDADFRFEINLQLARMGHEVSEPLFADLDNMGEVDDGLQSLWYIRDKLTLLPDQASRLWDYITKDAARTRRRCMTEQYYPPTAKLISYLRNGLPFRKGDIEHLAQSVFKPDILAHQKYVIRVIAAFKSDEARIWLRRISEADVRPSLRRLARSELFKLEAPTRRG